MRADGYTPSRTSQLADAVLARKPRLACFGGVPVSDLADGLLTSLELSGCGLGPAEALVLGQLTLRAAPLAQCNLDGYELLCVSELRGAPDGHEQCDQPRDECAHALRQSMEL